MCTQATMRLGRFAIQRYVCAALPCTDSIIGSPAPIVLVPAIEGQHDFLFSSDSMHAYADTQWVLSSDCISYRCASEASTDQRSS